LTGQGSRPARSRQSATSTTGRRWKRRSLDVASRAPAGQGGAGELGGSYRVVIAKLAYGGGDARAGIVEFDTP
jgi:hypothetical protein